MKFGWLALMIAAAATPAPAPETPPGTLVDVGGRRLHLRCLGTGSPTVILTAGLGDGGETWKAVQPSLSKTTRTCTWDRAGIGHSDGSAEPQDVAHTTSDLERLLALADVGEPYVLVGHSIGSFETQMLAYRLPAKVAGIVLVDPSSPFQNRAFAAASPAFAEFNAGRLKARTDQLRECAAGLRSQAANPAACGGPASTRPTAARIAAAEAIASMTEQWDSGSAQLTAATRGLGDIPLIVLTAGRRPPLPGNLEHEQPKLMSAWSQMHDRLARLSTRGERRLVADAGHYIQADRPDVVIAAIEEVVAEARRQAD